MKNYKIDKISYEIGMINCFVEMVSCGVKKLALSPPIDPSDYSYIEEASNRLVEGFGIKSYLEHELLISDIQSEEFTKGKWSILYYAKDEVLDMYLDLKRRKQELVIKGEYKGEKRRRIAIEFGRLLSYPDEIILDKISLNTPPTPFSLI